MDNQFHCTYTNTPPGFMVTRQEGEKRTTKRASTVEGAAALICNAAGIHETTPAILDSARAIARKAQKQNGTVNVTPEALTAAPAPLPEEPNLDEETADLGEGGSGNAVTSAPSTSGSALPTGGEGGAPETTTSPESETPSTTSSEGGDLDEGAVGGEAGGGGLVDDEDPDPAA